MAKFSRHSLLKWLILPLLLVTILVWAVVFTTPDDNLHVTFLNVGQGDAIFMAWSQYTPIVSFLDSGKVT